MASKAQPDEYIFSLKPRRLWSGLIDVCNVMWSIDKVNVFSHRQTVFSPLQSKTKGSRFKIRQVKCEKFMRGDMFTQLLVGIYYKLPEEAIESDSITIFKHFV